jgi:hypothetical protein
LTPLMAVAALIHTQGFWIKWGLIKVIRELTPRRFPDYTLTTWILRKRSNQVCTMGYGRKADKRQGWISWFDVKVFPSHCQAECGNIVNRGQVAWQSSGLLSWWWETGKPVRRTI